MANPLENIDVFILCGGKGKRLREISGNIPKPMMQVKGRPFLDIIIRHMAKFGFRRFILATGYKTNVIEDYYANNKILGLNILFSREKVPLDTGGAVKNAKKLIRSNLFFILNGDSFCKFNPLGLLRFHQQKKSLVSILLRREPNGNQYGQIEIDRFSRILKFKEKNSESNRCLINAGVYIFDKKVFRLMPLKSKFSLECDFFPKMSGRDIFGYLNSGFFIDIGTPERYLKTKRRFLANI